jgi:hypothetical protein
VILAILGILVFCVVGLWVLYQEIECVEEEKRDRSSGT